MNLSCCQNTLLNSSIIIAGDINALEIVQKFRSLVWTYFLPSISVFGLVTNLINAIVFSNRKQFKNPIYKCLLTHAIVELVYLMLSLSNFILKLTVKSFDSIYWLKLYELVIHLYITSSLSILIILIELFVSLKRLFIITNFRMGYNVSKLFLFFIAISFSFALNYPTLHGYSVTQSTTSLDNKGNNSSLTMATKIRYEYSLNAYGKGAKLENFLIALVRGLIAPLVLLILSTLIIYKFNKRLLMRGDMLKFGRRIFFIFLIIVLKS